MSNPQPSSPPPQPTWAEVFADARPANDQERAMLDNGITPASAYRIRERPAVSVHLLVVVQCALTISPLLSRACHLPARIVLAQSRTCADRLDAPERASEQYQVHPGAISLSKPARASWDVHAPARLSRHAACARPRLHRVAQELGRAQRHVARGAAQRGKSFERHQDLGRRRRERL